MSVFANEVGFSAAPGFVGGGTSVGGATYRPTSGSFGRGGAGSYQSPSRTPYQRPSNFKNSNGYNNRSNVGRGVNPQAKPQNTPTRGFSSTPARTPNKGGGFRDLLPKPIPRSKPQGFANPASKPVSRGIPVDTPTPGRKQPFKMPSLPRMPSGINLPNYPGRMPDGAIPAGSVTVPGSPIYGDSPWTGGQSVGIQYDLVYWAQVTFNYGYEQRITLGVVGPITSARKNNLPGQNFNFIISTANGSIETSNQFNTRNVDDKAYLIGFARSDGQPDTGGNPLGPQVGETAPERATNPSRTPYRPNGTDGALSPFARPTPNAPFTAPNLPRSPNLPTPQPFTAPLPSTAPLPDELKPPDKQPDRTTAPKDKPGFKPFESNKPQGRSSLTPSGAKFGTGVAVGRALQSSLDNAINSSELQDIKRMLQNPTQTTDEGRNKIFPTNGLTNGGTGVDKSVGLVNNPPANKPPTEIDKCCKPSSSSDSSECDLTEITNLLKTSVNGEILLNECKQSDANPITSNGEGIAGLSLKLDLLTDALVKVWDKVKCDDESTLLTPEFWPVRKGGNRPQLIVVYGIKNQDGTFDRATRFQMSIPWFEAKNRKILEQLLPKNVKKGRYQATITLADNSKIIQFCKTKTESIRVVKEFEKLVISKYRTGDIKTSDNQGAKREFKEVTVNPIMAKFYPTGQRDTNPVWTERFY